MVADLADIETLREQHEAARLLAETAELRASARVYEDLNKWVGNSGYLFDDSQRWLPLAGNGQYGNGQYGQSPAYSNETELALIRGTGRMFGQRNSTAISLLENLSSYIIGTGFGVECEARDWRDESSSAEAAAITDYLAEWQDRNRWPLLEQQMFRQSREDGELFLRLFRRPDGVTDVRIVEPEMIVTPRSLRDAERLRYQVAQDTRDIAARWDYGVCVDAADCCRVLGYWVDYGQTQEFVAAADIVALKLNTRHTWPRGLSDFYPVFESLDYVYKLTRNTAIGAAILASIVAIRQHGPGTSRSQADALRQSLATRQSSENYPVGSRIEYEQKMGPGRMLDVSGVDYHPAPIAAGHAETLVAVIQATLRDIGKRWCMPEYQSSGDASNANYSSTKEAGGPWQKFCRRQQELYSLHYAEMFRGIVNHAVSAGAIPEAGDVATLWRRVRLNITPPDTTDSNTEGRTGRLEKLANRGIIADSTWAAAEGFDLEQERAAGAGRIPPFAGGDQPGDEELDRRVDGALRQGGFQ